MAHRNNSVTDEAIVELYGQLKSGVKVARTLRVAEVTVYKVLRERSVATTGLADYRERIRKFDRETALSLLTKYEAGTSATQLAKEHGCSTEVVLKALRRLGANMRAKPRMTQQEKLEAKSLYESGLTFEEVAQKIGRRQATIIRLMNSAHPDIVRSKRVGPGGPHWRNGRTHDGQGYIYVWVGDDDPMKCMAVKNGRNDRNRYVLEHRLVMARKLGRPLLPTETVHHINGDKADNRPKNLQLRQGKHGKHVVMCCRDCGSRNIGPAEIAH